MNKRIWIGLPLLILAAFILAAWLLLSHKPGARPQSQLVAASVQEDVSGFQKAGGVREFHFPADFGPHLDYQTEWWYYTGNLDAPGGRHFGYQLTFFRRALLPSSQFKSRASDWATRQVYMAHFALTDVSARRYQAFERLQRGAAGLAGAQAGPYRVWLDDWQVSQSAPDVYHLQAAVEGGASPAFAIDLTLQDSRGPLLQGQDGFSRKGSGVGQASYYFSQTRLITNGTLKLGEEDLLASGLSWMDHEFSTSALTREQVGWDWFALQLNSQPANLPLELMIFQIRKADGSADPYSSGTLVNPDGSHLNLSADSFIIQVLSTWTSPHSGAVYPARWKVELPNLDLELEIEPYLADQELNLSYTYWEGAVKVSGAYRGQAVSGSGYVELTGYASSMGGEF